jgi:type IV pilus assembly protein PilA
MSNMIERLKNRIATSEKQGGFTLIELLVVMIIIAILLAIAIPSYLGFKGRAEQRTAESNVRAAVPAAEAYYGDHDSYAGMTFATLEAIDQGLATGLAVNVTGGGTGYCLSFTKGTKTAHVVGPGGTVASGACP